MRSALVSWPLGLLLSALFLAGMAAEESANPEADRVATAIEALCRIENVDLSQNERLKATVARLLQKTRGTPNFVRLVRQFKLKDQTAGLLEVAASASASDASTEAMRLVIENGELASARAAFQTGNITNLTRLVGACSGLSDAPSSELLQPIVVATNLPVSVRKLAVQILSRKRTGADALLELARRQRLPDDLRFVAGMELGRARWPEVKKMATEIFPPPAGRNAQPLPPLAELVQRTGSPDRGAKVFFSATAGCATCHLVRGQGVDFGPNLSEIGTKLGKDAIYEAILDPSAGISFGFEAWQLKLRSGDDILGLIASETAEEVAVKAVGGTVTRYKIGDILQREKSALSIMPAGLQQAMSTEELVDLVEYLSSLRK